jgi:hypothetical protein
MVFIVNRGKLITGKQLSHQSDMSQLSIELNQPSENMEPELGLPTDSMQEDSGDNFNSFNMNEVQGEGFRVAGAGIKSLSGVSKMKYIPKQDKIRKFISLKL